MANKGNTPWNKMSIDRDELYDLYINQQMTSQECANYFHCTSKTIRNKLKEYNIPVRSTGDSIKLERSKWSDEKELERSRKFSNTFSQRTPEQNKERYDKMNVSGKVNSPESILKAHQTRLQNGTSNKSKAEEAFYHKLLLLGFNEDDIIHTYIGDERYPYNCDFYIKSKDLFIEYQGHQTHGYKPFNKNDEECLKQLVHLEDKANEGSKMAKDIIITWTIRDPKKLNTAINNNIKLVLVYPKHNVYLIKNGKMTTININDINRI